MILQSGHRQQLVVQITSFRGGQILSVLKKIQQQRVRNNRSFSHQDHILVNVSYFLLLLFYCYCNSNHLMPIEIIDKFTSNFDEI